MMPSSSSLTTKFNVASVTDQCHTSHDLQWKKKVTIHGFLSRVRVVRAVIENVTARHFSSLGSVVKEAHKHWNKRGTDRQTMPAIELR